MKTIKTIGVMTGNSLDAVDVVLTEFDQETIKDICALTLDYPKSLTTDLLKLRELIKQEKSVIENVADNQFFIDTVNTYSKLVAKAVNDLVLQNNIDKNEVAAIGFHGQTCDHFPPSIAKDEPPYTLQIGNAQLLADLTGIKVIYDFRSDDIMNGGEGAPLAPIHNQHISRDLKSKGLFPVAFCNAGNTGNIAIITEDKNQKPVVMGWDVGPFNHLSDYLMRTYKNKPFDKDGEEAKKGKVNPELLEKLFYNVAINNSGNNFYLQSPPKSSDPSWYRIVDDLKDLTYGFADTLRTVEYLSAYTFFHSLSHVPLNLKMPSDFMVFGGGWKNPVAFSDFKNLLSGKGFILEEHQETFAIISSRFKKDCTIDWSDKYGYSGQYMEARIFADMAYCKIINEPFSHPETTGCKSPTLAGVYCYPNSGEKPKLWNRAAKGWQSKLV